MPRNPGSTDQQHKINKDSQCKKNIDNQFKANRIGNVKITMIDDENDH